MGSETDRVGGNGATTHLDFPDDVQDVIESEASVDGQRSQISHALGIQGALTTAALEEVVCS